MATQGLPDDELDDRRQQQIIELATISLDDPDPLDRPWDNDDIAPAA